MGADHLARGGENCRGSAPRILAGLERFAPLAQGCREFPAIFGRQTGAAEIVRLAGHAPRPRAPGVGSSGANRERSGCRSTPNRSRCDIIPASVSSTCLDLKAHRASVIARLPAAGSFTDPMERWSAARDARRGILYGARQGRSSGNSDRFRLGQRQRQGTLIPPGASGLQAMSPFAGIHCRTAWALANPTDLCGA